MSRENVEIVRRCDAWNRGDLDTFADLFDADAKRFDPAPNAAIMLPSLSHSTIRNARMAAITTYLFFNRQLDYPLFSATESLVRGREFHSVS